MLLFGLYVLSSKKPVETPVLDAQPTAVAAQPGIVPESAKVAGLSAGGVPATRCMNVANWARVTLPFGSKRVVPDIPVVTPLYHAHETFVLYQSPDCTSENGFADGAGRHPPALAAGIITLSSITTARVNTTTLFNFFPIVLLFISVCLLLVFFVYKFSV
jgi:hypothetical protein